MVGLTDKLLPVPASVPPHAAVYHFTTALVPPPPPFKVRVVLPPLHIIGALAVAEVGLVDF